MSSFVYYRNRAVGLGKRYKEMEVFREFILGCGVFLIDQKIIDKTIEIRSRLKIKIPDAIIAATAIENGLTLISYNQRDFDRLVPLGLKYINPKNI